MWNNNNNLEIELALAAFDEHNRPYSAVSDDFRLKGRKRNFVAGDFGIGQHELAKDSGIGQRRTEIRVLWAELRFRKIQIRIRTAMKIFNLI